MNTSRFSDRLGIGALCASALLVGSVLVVNGMSSPAPAAPVGDPCDITAPAGKHVETFNYTGGSQTFTVPAGVTSIDVDVCGAEGGNSGYAGSGGLGAHAKATLAVTAGDALTVQVGGAGIDGVTATDAEFPNAGGYNGGGARGNTTTGAGGGASDIRTGAGAASDRVIVAGGGGGGGGYTGSTGGDGGAGGTEGADGGDDGGIEGGEGGKATETGDGGQGFFNGGDGVGGTGGTGAWYVGGAGGGGYYGGGGGAADFGPLRGGGGGGGSSLVTGAGVSGGSVEDGVVSGNGKVAITYVLPDVDGPTVTINQWGLQDDPTSDPTVAFEVVFSEPVTGFSGSDLSVTGTASPLAGGAIVTSDNMTFVVTMHTVTSDGTVIATVPAGVAKDAAGNDNAASTSTDNSVTVDTTAPTATINQASDQDDPADVSPVKFDVKFSEDVTGLQDNDVSLGDSTAPGTLEATVTGSGDSYVVSVTGMTGAGTVVAKLSDEGGVAEDAAGNEAEVATWTDNEVTYNPVDPNADTDGDGLTNGEEADLGTNPNKPDTDGDGLKDGRELDGFAKCPAGTDPLKKDTDADGLGDYAELLGFNLTTKVYSGENVPKKYKVIGLVKTNPCAADTDGDKLSDASEVKGNVVNQKVIRIKKYGPYTITTRKTNPLVKDTDQDGLSDRQEVTGTANTAHGKRKSDPTVADTDWGGAKDGAEVKRKSDPTRADS